MSAFWDNNPGDQSQFLVNSQYENLQKQWKHDFIKIKFDAYELIPTRINETAECLQASWDQSLIAPGPVKVSGTIYTIYEGPLILMPHFAGNTLCTMSLSLSKIWYANKR